MQRRFAPMGEERRFEHVEAGVGCTSLEQAGAQAIDGASAPQRVERRVGLRELRRPRRHERRQAARRDTGADDVVLLVGVDDAVARAGAAQHGTGGLDDGEATRLVVAARAVLGEVDHDLGRAGRQDPLQPAWAWRRRHRPQDRDARVERRPGAPGVEHGSSLSQCRCAAGSADGRGWVSGPSRSGLGPNRKARGKIPSPTSRGEVPKRS